MSLSGNEFIEKTAGLALRKAGSGFRTALILSLLLAVQGIASIVYTLFEGLGVWGINNSSAWGISIVNFVYWIGIGHAGTLISAILLLFRQRWRSSMNRSAEAMTIFAIICAAIFPLIHTGRPWFALYWLFPYPNQMALFPNFRSPLVWDSLAIFTYFIVSLMFWYLGMLPDFAIIKKRGLAGKLDNFYAKLSFGWSGSSQQWRSYKTTNTLFAGLATFLVISVHSIVSFDFAVSLLPGWHTTIFPPYFVAGAILSGCAMVSLMLIVTRKVLGLESIIKDEHFDKLNKLTLLASLIIAFSYFTEIYSLYISGVSAEFAVFNNRFAGLFPIVIIFNVIIPQLYWFGKFRRSGYAIIFISIIINIGMWLERYVIFISSQSYDMISGSFVEYLPTLIDISIFAGSFGLFFTFYLLFIKFFPVVSIAESESLRVKK